MNQACWRPAAILFDFDGTLADSYPAITASVNHVRALKGQPPLTTLEVRRHVGHGPSHLLAHTVPGVDLEVDLARYRLHHPTVMHEGTVLFPRVAETLHQLKGRGIRLAVCSNKPVAFTSALLDGLSLLTLFSEVLGPEDVPRPKPSPDMLLEAMRRLDVHAKDVLYVGDMVVDIETARAAGARVWVVQTGSDSPEALAAGRPDRILTSFEELRVLVC